MKKERQNQTVYYTSTMPILIKRVGQLMMLTLMDQRIFGRKPETCYNFESNPLFSKYNSGFTYVALLQKRTSKPTVEFLKDSIAGNKRYLKLRISQPSGKSL
jgi:hypothetical protein